MATIDHQTEHLDFGVGGISPGESKWLQWVGDLNKDSTVHLKADPMTAVAGTTGPTHQTMVASVGPIYVTSIPIFSGGFLLGSETYVGASFTNAGSHTIRYLRVTKTRIRA
jgi:hypothetical protein